MLLLSSLMYLLHMCSLSVLFASVRRFPTADDLDTHAEGYPCHSLMPVITCSSMQSFISGDTTVIVVPDEFSAEDWTTAVAHITGEYEWWYGEIGDGLFAYVITEVDVLGDTRVPDWQGLPLVLKSHIMARLRRAVPS